MIESIEKLTSDFQCRQCGYNLNGLGIEGTCPECGAPFSQPSRGCLHDVVDLIENHNREAKTMFGVYLAGAIVAWPVSYAICWWLYAIIYWTVFEVILKVEGFWWIPHALAMLTVAAMAFKSFREASVPFDPADIADSPVVFDRYNRGIAYATGHIMTWSVIISHVLLIAPRATNQAIEHRRSTVEMPDPTDIAQAQKAIDALWKSENWSRAKDLGLNNQLIAILKKAGILWTEIELKDLRVRLDPSLCTQQ